MVSCGMRFSDQPPAASLAYDANPYSLTRFRSSVYTSPEACQPAGFAARSEEHTSALQSRSDLVCRLLLEKKKDRRRHNSNTLPTPQPEIRDSAALPTLTF